MPIEGKDRKPLSHHFPAWFYGPKGESELCHSEADVPNGWKDHPSKHPKDEHVEDEKEKLNTGTADDATGTTIETGAGGNTNFASGDDDRLDVDGHPWNVEFHAATRSKTNDGRWRMKVGVTRPAPVEGYPKGDEARETVNERSQGDGSPPLDL